MKKTRLTCITAYVIAFLMILGIAACGGNTSTAPTATPMPDAAANTPETITTAAATTTAATTAAETTTEKPKETTTTAAATTTAATTTAKPAETTTAAETTTTEAVDIMSEYGRYPETLVITTAKSTPSAPNFLPGDDSENNPMTRYILDRINVKVKVAWEIAGENNGFANKMALQIAANDIPDMFTLSANDYLLYRQLADNDMLADLKPGYDACANAYVKDTLGTYEGRNMAPFYQGDKLLALAGGRYGYEHNQLWIRKDWVDASGFELPKTVDDMELILREWKENPPSSDYVGFSLHHSSMGGVYDGNSASPLFASFGSFPRAWVKGSDGKTVWGSVAPETKDGLAVLARWYKEGLIDQQFMTRSAGGARPAMIVASQTGMIFAPWWVTYNIGEFPLENPGAEIIPINAPLDPQGNFTIMFPGAAGDYVMIRKGYSNPEAVVKIINLEFDMWRGFDPVAADLIAASRENNVSWGYLFPTSGFNIEPNTAVPMAGIHIKEYVDTGVQNPAANPQVQEIAVAANIYAKEKRVEGVSWIEYYGRYIGSSAEMMLADYVKVKLPEYYFVTESMADIKPNLDTLEETTFLKIVTGELPVDAFDTFVEDWYAQGGQKITDEVRFIIGEN